MRRTPEPARIYAVLSSPTTKQSECLDSDRQGSPRQSLLGPRHVSKEGSARALPDEIKANHPLCRLNMFLRRIENPLLIRWVLLLST